jgi:hypothetical protein
MDSDRPEQTLILTTVNKMHANLQRVMFHLMMFKKPFLA